MGSSDLVRDEIMRGERAICNEKRAAIESFIEKDLPTL